MAQAQRQRGRRQEDAGRSGRRSSSRPTAWFDGRGRPRRAAAAQSHTVAAFVREPRASMRCPPTSWRARSAACSTSIGVAAAAQSRARRSASPPLRGRRTWAARGREARILFDGRRASLAGAAFAGAATIDALDAHDGHVLTKGHAGVAVLPALLAFIGRARLRRTRIHHVPGAGLRDRDPRGHRAACEVAGLSIAPARGMRWRARRSAPACCRLDDAQTAPSARHRRVLGAARPDHARVRIAVDGEGRIGLGRARGRRRRRCSRATDSPARPR